MGLDMFLSKRIYIGANYEHRNVKGVISITKDEKEIPVNFNLVTYVEEDAMYWRKANHIHNWFVENVQAGEDDCGKYDVSIEKLTELRDICQTVIESLEKSPKQTTTVKDWNDNDVPYEVYTDTEVAEDLLPTTRGFFFGGTEYDEWYFKKTAETRDRLTQLIEESEREKEVTGWDTEFTYQSSW